LARAALPMCAMWVGFLSSFFFAGGRKKQNKFPSNLHCPVTKLNPFLFLFYRYRICLFVCFFTLVANSPGMPTVAGLRAASLSAETKVQAE